MSILSFILLITLVIMRQKNIIRVPSGVFSYIYLLMYSIGRFWIESLRTDPLCLGGLPPFCEGGIRIAQLVSLLLLFSGILGLWWLYFRRKEMPVTSKIQPKRFQ